MGVPVALLIFLALCVPVAVLLNKSPFGHRVYMIGSNEKPTRYSGVDTKVGCSWASMCFPAFSRSSLRS